jgi:hypothetical protein
LLSKKCIKCEQEKPLSEYYKHSQMSDGTLNKCKECTKTDARGNRRKNAAYYKEYDRKRGNRQPKDYLKKYRERNPEIYKAHCAVNNAVRDKRLIKESCFICGDINTVGHHVDYSKPLEVIWLCQCCHKKIHAYEDRANEIRAS